MKMLQRDFKKKVSDFIKFERISKISESWQFLTRNQRFFSSTLLTPHS